MRQWIRLYSLFSFLLLVCLGSAFAFSTDSKATAPWHLTITVAESDKEQSLNLCSANHFHVVLTNHSGTSQRFWKQSNSWGYSILSFVVTDGNGKTYIIKRKPRSWRKNYPGFITIKASESYVFNVSFSNESWDVPQTVCELNRFKIQAIINITNDQQTNEYNVWAGRIKSAIYEFKDPKSE